MAPGMPVVIQTPLHAPSTELTYNRPASASSDGVSRIRVPYPGAGGRQASAESRTSSRGAVSISHQVRDENAPPVERPRTSSSNPHVPERLASAVKPPKRVSRASSWSTVLRASSDGQSLRAVQLEPDHVSDIDEESLFEVYDEDKENIPPEDTFEKTMVKPAMNAEMAVQDEKAKGGISQGTAVGHQPDNATGGAGRRPLRRWFGALRRKRTATKQQDHAAPTPTEPEKGADEPPDVLSPYRQQRSPSNSSMDILSVIKSASTGVAGHASATVTAATGLLSRKRSWARSSEAFNVHVRMSEDGRSTLGGPVEEEAVWKRATERRQILEELISSEESYIADMKILVNVYFALLGSVPALSSQTRTSIHRNVIEILALHEDLLGELHRVVPNSELNQQHSIWWWPRFDRRRHQRSSIESAPEAGVHARAKARSRRTGQSNLVDQPSQAGITAEAKIAGDVAKVFTTLMKRFLAYEEYGAKYETMVREVASTYKTIPTWHAYERGIEALANSLSHVNKDESPRRKGLTFEDLIIKPIQRVCKYPLLFAALYKVTPVYDCPEAHAELEKVLYRLREVTAEINKATHDPQTRDRLEKTWLLQDKLVFVSEVQGHQLAALWLFGRVILCGALHVAWQSADGPRGEYMVCILFRSYLLLAVAGENSHLFAVVACISLENVKLEPADNGNGLQCHNAWFTWKILFEVDCNLYEIMVSACSAREEEVWKSNLNDRLKVESLEADGRQTKSPNLYSSLSLDIKVSGSVFGYPGTLARRLSVRRATTTGVNNWLAQVIIRNTHALRESMEAATSASGPYPPSVNRSQSLLSTARIPVLAPRRAERIRLEQTLADIWTRDMIPYPGMSGKRGEGLIKASASSMMRKLSMASLASTFSKRSTSYAGCGHVDMDHPNGPVDHPSPARGKTPDRKQRLSEMDHPDTGEAPKPIVGSTPRKGSVGTRTPRSQRQPSGAAVLPQGSPSSGAINTSGPANDGGNCQTPKGKTSWRSPKVRKGNLARTLSVDGIRKIFK